jgi:3-ketosteroid 9alpha-monooxygenase subunit A
MRMSAATSAARAAAAPHRIEAQTLPARFARGWHCLGLASDYQDGKPHSLDIFGTRLVVFQGADGALRVLDAWCPHMGADLGLGQIKGNALVCRFHSWEFGGDGKCAHIPYSKRVPPKARVRAWHVQEENKLLFLWHDPEGDPPPVELAIPRLAPAFSPDWSDWNMSQWTIHNNCRELVDNLADLAHFGPVHGSESVVYFANIYEGHKATQVMVGRNERLGGHNNYLTTVATYFGPACLICSMRGEAGGLPVESLLLVTHVPIDPNSFELRFGVMVKKIPGLSEAQNRELIKGYVDLTCKAFGEDVAIWHNKIRIDNPLLCDGDGPIYQLREWYGQFYVDAGAVAPALKERRVIEMDLGLAQKPVLAHVFEA